MANPVVHFEVVGKDVNNLQSFYGAIFDWKIESVMPEYAMVHPGVGIEGGIGGSQDGGAGHVTFYVQVPDLEATLKEVEEQGGKTVAGPMDVPGGPTIAMFTDPEGHLIGLIKEQVA